MLSLKSFFQSLFRDFIAVEFLHINPRNTSPSETANLFSKNQLGSRHFTDSGILANWFQVLVNRCVYICLILSFYITWLSSAQNCYQDQFVTFLQHDPSSTISLELIHSWTRIEVKSYSTSQLNSIVTERAEVLLGQVTSYHLL